jgi:mannose-6-phosphate isomerase-like protein (cupin superfamily)
VAVATTLTRHLGVAPSRDELNERFQREGLDPRWWGNAAGDSYGWHAHGYHKVLFCQQGSITFHTRQGDVELHPGDRLDVEAGTEHAATVGSQGVACVEAARE